MPELLSTALLLVLIVGAVMTARRLGWIKSNKSVSPPKNVRYISDIMKKPEGPREQGMHDMLLPVLGILYKKPEDIIDYIPLVKDKPLTFIAEALCEDEHRWRMQKYDSLDLKKGRISRKYLASPNSDDFAQYILGGREILDELDKKITMVQDEKQLEKARIEGLADSDRRYKETRKSLKHLQNPQIRAKDEFAEFDEQMKELGNGN